ncbi:MAG: hypothetical protein ACYC7J_18430 [Syntrophales bacterium]
MGKSNLTTRQMFAEILTRLDAMKEKPGAAPFGFAAAAPAGGQILPQPTAPPVEVDVSDYVHILGKPYNSYVDAYGVKGLVAIIRQNWGKRDTFYPPAKEFVADYPQYFEGIEG